MEWTSDQTAAFWKTCQERAIASALLQLLDVKLSMPAGQPQAGWTEDQVTSAITESTKFLRDIPYPTPLMIELVDLVPGILSWEPEGG